SGTILIEAAMKAANIAPGVSRNFLAEHWDHLVPRSEWAACREEALEMENRKIELSVQGFDIDGKVLKLARENARLAGVDHLIHLQQRPVSELQHSKKYGFLITNPPYGERLEDKQALPKLYQELGESYRRLDNWSMYVITSYEHAERDIGRKADRNRKLYNGMIKTYYYQFLGARPPRRENRQGRAS
ncbi:MAG: THUMP domain-containing class I SAM-dependent RNA methyltransferase, partial [Lachnospiraceae bacterium]